MNSLNVVYQLRCSVLENKDQTFVRRNSGRINSRTQSSRFIALWVHWCQSGSYFFYSLRRPSVGLELITFFICDETVMNTMKTIMNKAKANGSRVSGL